MSVFYTVFGVSVVVGRRVCLFFTQCLVVGVVDECACFFFTLSLVVGVAWVVVRYVLFFTQCLVLVWWWVVVGCFQFLFTQCILAMFIANFITVSLQYCTATVYNCAV